MFVLRVSQQYGTERILKSNESLDFEKLKQKQRSSGPPDVLQVLPKKKKIKHESAREMQVSRIPDTEEMHMAAGQRGDMMKRSILIIGKVGVGKATIANKIVGYPAFPVRESMQGITRESEKMKTREVQGYSISIIDLTRQYDYQPQESFAAELRQVCEKPLHSILFVIQKGRLTQGEKFIFEHIINNCPKNAKAVSDLIITNCELEKDNARRKIKSDFETDSNIIAQFVQGIYTVGFPNTDRMKDGVRKMYDEVVENDMKRLHELIRSRDVPQHVTFKQLEGAMYIRDKNDQMGCLLQ